MEIWWKYATYVSVSTLIFLSLSSYFYENIYIFDAYGAKYRWQKKS